MTDAGRFVVLGLAPARAPWFSSVGLWATTGALPVEFVRCVSAEEVRARLRAGRPYSALIADAEVASLDRDLVAAATGTGCTVIVVADSRRPGPALPGISRLLPPTFTRDDLLAALESGARRIPIGDADAAAVHPGELGRGERRSHPPTPSASRGALVAVTGPGGTGVSTAAMALAQALSTGSPAGGWPRVVLADLRLHAEQAVLHDRVDVGPGLQELVEAHRRGEPSSDEVQSLAPPVPGRGYALLCGLRRARLWPAVRSESFAATLDSLQATYATVVCDIDSDFEGENDGGSLDVEERNVMARTSASRARAVFVVGLPSVKAIHSLVRVTADLAQVGVAPARVVAVLNRTPRSPRERARVACAVNELTRAATGRTLGGLVFLPERPIEAELRDSVALPSALGSPLAGALAAVLDRVPADDKDHDVRPRAVLAGSLGVWTDA